MVNTVSTTAMPPSRLPSTSPISVQVGPKALRNAWRISTADSGRPLARACVM